MAAKFSEGLSEQVTCPICLEHYSDPRLLPCLHTYCRRCLQDLLNEGKTKVSLVCPECREEVPIISGDVTKLKVNFWINNLLLLLAIQSTDEEQDGGETELACENCDSKAAAKGRCVNCSVFLCNVCYTAHQRLQALKDHQLMTMDEMKKTGIQVIEKEVFCEKHKGEVKDLFCNTCQELICLRCALIDHRDHQFKFVEDVAKQYKQLCNTEIERASNTKDKIEAVVKSIQKMKENVEETSKATERDIDDFINKQIRALEDKRASLKQTTRKAAAIKMKELTAQEDVLVMHITGLKSAIQLTEKVLTNGNNSDVLSVSKELTSRLSHLSKKRFPKDLRHEDPWQNKKTRLEFNEILFRDSLNQVEVNIVDHEKCSVVLSRINGRLVNIQDSIGIIHGQYLEFVIIIKNVFGDKLKEMADRIQAKVSIINGKVSTLPITSLEDDTYSIGQTISSVYHKSIQVTVDGKDISRSPITFFDQSDQ